MVGLESWLETECLWVLMCIQPPAVSCQMCLFPRPPHLGNTFDPRLLGVDLEKCMGEKTSTWSSTWIINVILEVIYRVMKTKGQKMMSQCNECFHVQCVLCVFPMCACQYRIIPSFLPLHFHFLCFSLSGAEHVPPHILICLPGVWLHLARQQGGIHIIACSPWFIMVHDGGGTTQNTAEVRILPYGSRRGNEQPYGSSAWARSEDKCLCLCE